LRYVARINLVVMVGDMVHIHSLSMSFRHIDIVVVILFCEISSLITFVQMQMLVHSIILFMIPSMFSHNF